MAMPMGSGGVDVDMVTGLPIDKSPVARQQRAIGRHREAVQRSIGILAELQAGSPLVRILFEKARDRLIHLASQDPEFQALHGVIAALRYEVEVAPLLAEDIVRREMGPQLEPFIGNQAAPEGIPASE